ncbi:MAG: hypothetical protein ACK56F_00265, partial [bacterium]
ERRVGIGDWLSRYALLEPRLVFLPVSPTPIFSKPFLSSTLATVVALRRTLGSKARSCRPFQGIAKPC